MENRFAVGFDTESLLSLTFQLKSDAPNTSINHLRFLLKSLMVDEKFTLGPVPVSQSLGHLGLVVQRADNFIHWISDYPAEQMYSNYTFDKFSTQSHT